MTGDSGTPTEEDRDSQRLEKLVQQIARKDIELYKLIELILQGKNINILLLKNE